MSDVDKLIDVILKVHGCKAAYLESVPIDEHFQGRLVWSGVVEVFMIEHEKAERCYAWSFKDEKEKKQFVAVLGIKPVISPRSAVQAYIVNEFKRKS